MIYAKYSSFYYGTVADSEWQYMTQDPSLSLPVPSANASKAFTNSSVT